MSPELTLGTWASKRRERRAHFNHWHNKLHEDSLKLKYEVKEKIVQAFLEHRVGLTKDEAELYLADSIQDQKKFKKEYIKATVKVYNFLNSSATEEKNFGESHKKFFLAFREATGSYYTEDELKQLDKLMDAESEHTIVMTLLGDNFKGHLHQLIAYDILQKAGHFKS